MFFCLFFSMVLIPTADVKKTLLSQLIGGLSQYFFGGQPMILYLASAPLALISKVRHVPPNFHVRGCVCAFQCLTLLFCFGFLGFRGGSGLVASLYLQRQVAIELWVVNVSSIIMNASWHNHECIWHSRECIWQPS